MVRRPVAIAYAEGKVVVVCHDGTVWHRSLTVNEHSTWAKVPHPVSGTEADRPQREAGDTGIS